MLKDLRQVPGTVSPRRGRQVFPAHDAHEFSLILKASNRIKELPFLQGVSNIFLALQRQDATFLSPYN